MLASTPGAAETIVQSATAFTAVVQSPVAAPILMPAVANSATAMATVVASPTLLSLVTDSTTAMTAITNSTIAMGVVAASRAAMDAIYAKPLAVKAIMPSAWGVFAPHTTQLVLDTTNVDTWINAEGTTQRNFSQESFSRPTYSNTQAVNGYDVLQFASGQLLESTIGLNRTEYTIFCVYRRAATANYGLYGDAGSDGITITGTASINVANNGSSGGTFSVPAHASTTWGLSRFRRSGSASLRHSLNGGDESIARTTNLPDFSNAVNYIGQGFDAAVAGSQVGLIGQIAEIVILTHGATINAEVTRVTNLLLEKYNL
jgi:hypothetical protein